jgi:N-acetylglucosamine-6-phosphate deacetylase
MECLRFTVKTTGIPLEKAIKCVTTNPAKVHHVKNILGSLNPE